MTKNTSVNKTMGLDLSDRESTYVVFDEEGKVEREGKVTTTARALERFGEGERMVVALGAYLGLTPRQQASGEQQPQLGITHAGDRYLRTLLVECAHRIMRGKESDLRRFGERLAERGGKNQKKRAIVAVARKLAVLLHHLWVTGEVYEPLRQGNEQLMAA